ncbi:MAG: septum site-determining protein MinD [Clostridiales bacterium]|nr:septum site-determining protein MinD [Clostridiales bacterium]
MGKVILIASGKGGTGKTVFTANAGAILAQRGHKVVLIDMDMGLRNLDLCLGLEDRVVYDVADVLTGLCRIKQALVRDKRFGNLFLMSSPPSSKHADITPLHMKVLCKKLRNNFDYILIDAPAGINDTVLMSAAGADSAVIITVPEHAAIRDADILYAVLKEHGITDIKYVLNKVRSDLISTGFVPGINEISRKLRPTMAGIIQYDDNIHIASNNGLPVVFKKGTYIEENFNKIVDRIIE